MGFMDTEQQLLWHFEPGNTAKASECSAPAIPNMSVENNGSSEMGAGQRMVSYSVNLVS